MRFAVWPSYERSWEETLALARWTEASGLHGFWYADHFMPDTQTEEPGVGTAYECWTMLTAVGVAVPRLTLTSMVSPVTIHHPVVLAKRAATLDHITGGRAVLGIGVGWQLNEHAVYGFELPPPGERVTRFERAIEQIHSLLHNPDVPFDPRPESLEILVGTGSPRMTAITARWADVWNTWGHPQQVRDRTAVFLAACDRVGRDPATVRRSAQALIFLTDDAGAAERIREMAPDDRSLIGGSAQLVDLLGEYVEAGVDEFALPDFTLGRTPEERADTYARLNDEVVSAFR
jgi:alkanesulfonate monooxygenase SsuD/methylene tetrahydromethanopterin reductase-like flavin-dependent oxidoreductase (luciferase family)